MTPEVTTDNTLTVLGRAKEYIRRSYRTWRIGPLVGIAEVCIILELDRQTVYRWKEPGSDVEATKDALTVLAAAGVVTDAELADCLPPPVGRGKDLRVDRKALKAMIDRLRADGNDRAAQMLSDCTHMPRPAIVGGGPEYGEALERRIRALRDELVELEGQESPKARRRAKTASLALGRAEAALRENANPDVGRAVWLLDDVVRFGEEIGRIRLPVGQSRPRKPRASRKARR